MLVARPVNTEEHSHWPPGGTDEGPSGREKTGDFLDEELGRVPTEQETLQKSAKSR